jgi:hypothetical protein
MCFGPSLFASIAFILSIVTNSQCYLVDLDDDNLLRSLPGIQEIDSVGLWCYEATNGNNYDITDFEFLGSKLEAARGLGTTALFLGCCIWIAYLVAACVPFPPMVFKVMGGLCILTCLFQGLVFLIFKADEICDGDNRGCSLGIGGNCGVAAVVFWFLAGIFSCTAGKKDDDAPANEAPADEPKDDEPKDDEPKDDEPTDEPVVEGE